MHKDTENDFNDFAATINEWIGTYHVFSNTAGTGMNTFLNLFREYLDEHRSGNSLFTQLAPEKNTYKSKYLHACRVLYLDFSDFSCKTIEDARLYISKKMSLLYKEHFDLWEWDEEKFRFYNSAENCLDIIEEKADDTQLKNSLRDLLYQATQKKRLSSRDSNVVLLINNIVLLESVAIDNQYEDWMESFLEEFIVEDVYKLCGTFLQIGDKSSNKPELDEWEVFSDRYLSYYRFGITDVDIWRYKY